MCTESSESHRTGGYSHAKEKAEETLNLDAILFKCRDIKEFAVNASKEEGEYYTPHDVVQMIAAMIEPFDGTLYENCTTSLIRIAAA